MFVAFVVLALHFCLKMVAADYSVTLTTQKMTWHHTQQPLCVKVTVVQKFNFHKPCIQQPNNAQPCTPKTFGSNFGRKPACCEVPVDLFRHYKHFHTNHSSINVDLTPCIQTANESVYENKLRGP
jgi:hypothetical protein